MIRWMVFLSVVLAWSGPIGAQNPPPELDRALRVGEIEGAGRFAFTQRIEGAEGQFTSRFDPSRRRRPWTLLSVNGRAPSDEERAELEGESAGGRPDVVGYPDLRRFMLRPRGVGAGAYLFSPDAASGKDAAERDLFAHLTGTAQLSEDRRYVAEVVLTNPQPFRPSSAVEVQQYRQIMRWGWDVSLNAPVLQLIVVDMAGMSFGQPFSERASVTVSDVAAAR